MEMPSTTRSINFAPTVTAVAVALFVSLAISACGATKKKSPASEAAKVPLFNGSCDVAVEGGRNYCIDYFDYPADIVTTQLGQQCDQLNVVDVTSAWSLTSPCATEGKLAGCKITGETANASALIWYYTQATADSVSASCKVMP